jgi:uncharacterized membrane protein
MQFSATDCIRFGWSTFKKRGWFLVGMTALMLVLSWVVGGIAGALDEGDASGLLGMVVNFSLSTLLSMGFTAVMLKAHDMLESVEVSDLWHPKPFLKFLAAELLTGLIIFVGLVLLVVPGIIAILTLLFTLYVVIDKGLGPIEAIKESARLARGHRWELLLLMLMVLVLNILGAVALFVGLLVSIPVTTLATMHAYRLLEAKTKPATT